MNVLTQEAIIKPEIGSTSQDTRSVSMRDKLFRSISKIHRIPDGHIASLDVIRFIASFFIVIGHAGPFYVSADYQGSAFIAPFVYVFFHIRRLGLPFFLMASGFLFGRSLEKGKPLIPRYIKAVKRLSRIFLIWTLFYAFEPFSNPHLRQDLFTFDMLRHYYWEAHHLAEQPLLLLISGTKYNLWFLPSLITSISILTLFILLKKTRYLPWIAIILYILSQCLHQEPMKSIVEMSDYFKYFRTYCRGIAFVACGWWFSQQTSFSLKVALKLFMVAVFSQIAQDLVLWHFYQLKPDSFMSIGVLPAISGIFVMIMCYPNFGKNTILHYAGSMTLGIYVLHPLIFNILELLDKKVMLLNTIVRDFTFPVVMAVASIFLTKILLKNNLSKRLIS